jgi:hypothetical protein
VRRLERMSVREFVEVFVRLEEFGTQ